MARAKKYSRAEALKKVKNIPLRCPCDLKETLSKSDDRYLCDNIDCEHHKPAYAFPCINNLPILISEIRTDTVCSVTKNTTYVERPLAKFVNLKKLIIGESKTTKINCEKFIDSLFRANSNPKVLVIGGGEKGSGADKLWDKSEIEIHSIDIYASDTVDVVCDGHYLPLEDGYYDGVWIQAVLEHVVEPSKVSDEIRRVLKIGGLVYAETPFMQQVHEGAYDFTRYTVLGHRYLFKRFELIDMGGNKGPELVFSWSVRYLTWAIFRSQKIARVIGLFFDLLTRPLGAFVSAESMYDASSGVYFFGKKSEGHNLTHKELVVLYKGQFKRE
jgi:SAM-dependent methyltransferase